MRLPPLVEPGPPLSAAERQRYARQIVLPWVGDLGQRRVRAARVCVVGAGGLGSPALLYLAAAGVGTLGVVEDDAVDLTNLHRQVLHDSDAVGTPKADSAARRLAALNPDCAVEVHPVRLEPANAADILGRYRLVLDCTDNFPSRYEVNDACAELGLPFVWGSIFRTQSQVTVFWKRPPAPAEGVDLRDLFPAPPDPATVHSCAETGVFGPLVGQTGSMMAIEALKLIIGAGDTLLGRVLFLDALSARVSEIVLRPTQQG